MKISAIITAYNSSAFIRDALDSILNQSRPLDEIWVVDDGSQDETAEIAAEYESRHVKYIRQENAGPGAARNLGIRVASGDVIAFLDADDTWMPEKIFLQERFLEDHPEIGIVSGHKLWRKKNETGEKTRLVKYGGMSNKKLRTELLFENVVGNPSMALIRKSVFEQFGGYDPSLRWGQDWEFWIRCSAGFQIGFVDAPVITYRTHGGNLTSETPLLRLECLFGISDRAIRERAVWIQRPFFLMRAHSRDHYFRSLIAIRRDLPWAKRVWHAFLSLFLFPWERTGAKARIFLQAFLGGKLYSKIKLGYQNPSIFIEE